MTYTGPPRPRSPREMHRQNYASAARAQTRGMEDERQLPFLIIGGLFRLVWWFPKTLFRIVRRK